MQGLSLLTDLAVEVGSALTILAISWGCFRAISDMLPSSGNRILALAFSIIVVGVPLEGRNCHR
jgi:hypothetical protein